MPAASVTAPMANALTFMLATAAGSARMAPMGPPSAGAAPRNGSVWISMTMTPIPDMNPEMTACGV